MDSVNAKCHDLAPIFTHGSHTAIITVWVLACLLQTTSCIIALLLYNAPNLFAFCSGQHDDPDAQPLIVGCGMERRVALPPKIDGPRALMHSKTYLRFNIGFYLWVFSVACFALGGLAISGAQHCMGGQGSRNGWWAIPWTMYAIVQGVLLILAGLSVVGSRLEWRRQVRRELKGKWREDDVSRAERGGTRAETRQIEEIIELKDIRPNPLVRQDKRGWENAGEGSSRMGRRRRSSRAELTPWSLEGRLTLVKELEKIQGLSYERAKMQAFDRAASLDGRKIRSNL